MLVKTGAILLECVFVLQLTAENRQLKEELEKSKEKFRKEKQK